MWGRLSLMALLLSAVRLVPAQNLVDVPLDGLQLLEPLFLFVIGVIQAVFLGDKLLDLGLQRFPGGQLGNAMRLEIPGCCVGYDKIALMGLPVCGAGFLGFLCPILPVGDAVLAAVQEVDLIKPLPVAHLHDFGFEVAQGSVGTSVLAADFRIGRPVHVGQERHFLNPQAVYDDMHMNVAAVVMPVRVGADKGLVAGKMLFTELFPQRLRPVYGQAVVRPVPRVKADDVVVAFHIFPPLVFLIAEIGPHTRNGKILPVAVQRGQPVVLAGDKPAGFIKDGLHGKLVMLKEKILLGGSVVGVFRVDMLECCQPRHLLS